TGHGESVVQNRTNEKKVWLITRVSRGLGKELARAVLAKGDVVIGTSRTGQADLEPGAGTLHLLPLDLTGRGRDSVRRRAGARALRAARRARQQRRVRAARSRRGGRRCRGRPRVRRQLFRAAPAGAGATPFMRARWAGYVVNVSSIAGLAPTAGSGLYAAAKLALEFGKDVIRYPFGEVYTRPGLDTRTRLLAAIEQPDDVDVSEIIVRPTASPY